MLATAVSPDDVATPSITSLSDAVVDGACPVLLKNVSVVDTSKLMTVLEAGVSLGVVWICVSSAVKLATGSDTKVLRATSDCVSTAVPTGGSSMLNGVVVTCNCDPSVALLVATSSGRADVCVPSVVLNAGGSGAVEGVAPRRDAAVVLGRGRDSPETSDGSTGRRDVCTAVSPGVDDVFSSISVGSLVETAGTLSLFSALI
jgi:hypothetical protein